MRWIFVLAIGCGSKSDLPGPTPPGPKPTPGVKGEACDRCKCEDRARHAGWHMSSAEARTVLADASDKIQERCNGLANVFDDRAALVAGLERCLASKPEAAASYCKPGDPTVPCCSIEITSREIAQRRFITVVYPRIGDYNTLVYEVGAQGPVRFCDWAPYATKECGGSIGPLNPSTCPGARDWAQLPAQLQTYLCSGSLGE